VGFEPEFRKSDWHCKHTKPRHSAVAEHSALAEAADLWAVMPVVLSAVTNRKLPHGPVAGSCRGLLPWTAAMASNVTNAVIAVEPSPPSVPAGSSASPLAAALACATWAVGGGVLRKGAFLTPQPALKPRAQTQRQGWRVPVEMQPERRMRHCKLSLNRTDDFFKYRTRWCTLDRRIPLIVDKSKSERIQSRQTSASLRPSWAQSRSN